ncbi:MAG: TSUP family transporter, partial [Polyangiales bacterium]
MTAPALAALFVIVLGAFSAEAVVGFGSTVLTVTLGAQLMPLERLLPAFVPLNLALSLYLVGRHWRSVELRMLLRQVVPFVAVGMVVGLALFRLRPTKLLELALAAFVIGLATLEIVRLLRGEGERPSKLTRVPAISILWLGGVVHGLFGSGGPMVVYYASREISDKGRFRATLSALWLALNGVLIANYASLGLLDVHSARVTLTLLPALVIALILGEWLHRRIDERMFR